MNRQSTKDNKRAYVFFSNHPKFNPQNGGAPWLSEEEPESSIKQLMSHCIHSLNGLQEDYASSFDLIALPAEDFNPDTGKFNGRGISTLFGRTITRALVASVSDRTPQELERLDLSISAAQEAGDLQFSHKKLSGPVSYTPSQVRHLIEENIEENKKSAEIESDTENPTL